MAEVHPRQKTQVAHVLHPHPAPSFDPYDHAPEDGAAPAGDLGEEAIEAT